MSLPNTWTRNCNAPSEALQEQSKGHNTVTGVTIALSFSVYFGGWLQKRPLLRIVSSIFAGGVPTVVLENILRLVYVRLFCRGVQ